MHRAKEFGLKAENVGYDLDAVVKRSRAVAKQLSGGVGFLMKKNKIAVVMGEATLAGQGQDHASRPTRAPRRSRRRRSSSPPARGRATCPGSRRTASGSGATSTRWCRRTCRRSCCDRLGRDRHRVRELLQHARRRDDGGRGADRILPVEDEEISAFAKKQFQKQKMTILEGATVKKLDRGADKVTATIEQGGKTTTADFDTVISAVGIVGNVENLGLEELGVKVDRTHVVVDEYCRTGVEGLYAIGDVAGAPWLAHKAMHEGVMVAELIAGAASASDGRDLDRRLHLLPAAGGERRADRGEGQGAGLRGQGRALPLHRQRQGDRARRARGDDQDRVRRQDRRAARRAHGRRRGDRADPGLRGRRGRWRRPRWS